MTFIVIAFIVILAFVLFGSKSNSNHETLNFAEIDEVEAKKLLSERKAKALDVRTSLEVSQGKISGSKNINFASPSFASALSAIEKNQAYIVYCRSGRRSRQACKIMAKQGFRKLYNLEGGYNTWN